MLNKEELIEVLKDNCKNWSQVSNGMLISEIKRIGDWRWEDKCFHRKGEVITESDVFSKPKQNGDISKEELIDRLGTYGNWDEVMRVFNSNYHIVREFSHLGWSWSDFKFISNGETVTQEDVFPKPKKCEKRSAFLDFLKTFEDWNHVGRFMTLYSGGTWGWELVDGYIRRQGHGVITEFDVFTKTRQFKPNHPIDNNLPEIVRTTADDVRVPVSTKWVSGL